MEYIFEVNISTDDDFRFPYIPRDMKYYPTNGTYSLNNSYDDKTSAIKDITDICAFLKEQMDTSRDWVKEMFNEHIDSFVRQVCEADVSVDTYIAEYMSGNYDGTELIFRVRPHRYDFSLNLTDEEAELIRKNRKCISIGQVKEAILALFRQ